MTRMGYDPRRRLDYVPVNTPDQVNDPFRWQPLRHPNASGATVVQRYLTPHWQEVIPFALTSPTIDQSVKLTFALANAQLDASIAAWNAKRCCRPSSPGRPSAPRGTRPATPARLAAAARSAPPSKEGDRAATRRRYQRT
jgi:hypothetical protein